MAELWTADQLERLDRRMLQELAKENGVKANIKTVDIVAQLIKRLVTPQQGEHVALKQQPRPQSAQSDNSMITTDDNIPQLQDDELMDVDAMTDDESKLPEEEALALDATFVIEREAVRSSPLSLTADDELPAILPAAENEAPLAATENKPPQLSPRLLSSVVETRGHPKHNRFAKKHEEHFATMQSIDVAAANTDARKKKLLDSISVTSNRLAQPKFISNGQRDKRSQSSQRFRSPSTPKHENFVFGDVPTEKIASVQRPYQAALAKSPRPRRTCARLPQTTAKDLTKKATAVKRLFIASTVPIDDENINRLATPKSSLTRTPVPKERRSYTPKSGRYEYVDTTKLSNAEFAMFSKRQRQEAKANAKRVL